MRAIITRLIFLFSFCSGETYLPVQTQKLSDGLYRITIEGINAVALIGSAGNTMLSDNFKDSHTPALLKELKRLGSKRIVYMINTHFHNDHCGGNKTIREGIIISHSNTKRALEVDHISSFWQDTSFAYPKYALPKITFSDKVTIWFGGEEIELIPYPGGHSSGDITVYFKTAKVMHISDLLFSIGFPAIDSERGGSAEKFAAHLNNIINNYPDDVVFVAGHGKEFSKRELIEYQKMISESTSAIRIAMLQGLSLEQIKKKQLLSRWDNWANGYFSCNDWAEILFYDQLWADSTNVFFSLNDYTGKYIDTIIPESIPLIFAPGVITTQGYEGCSGFSPNMNEFFFQRWLGDKPHIFITKLENKRWSNPELVVTYPSLPIYDFTVSPHVNRLVFSSSHQVDKLGKEQTGHNIFFVDRTEKGWGPVSEFSGIDINTQYHDSYPCLAANGNLYFFSNRPGGRGKTDIYFAEFKNGNYSSPVNMGAEINSAFDDWDPYIAPDESYIIFCSKRQDSLGEDDLYISFKTGDAEWSIPANMGNRINTRASENRPYVTPDGKYLFFTRNIGGNRDIYWVSTETLVTSTPNSSN